SQGSVASPDSIIESQPSLAKTIPARLHYVPFDAGVTAIAQMKSGAVQAISGVGNPPVTEAIGTGTGITVVMGWGFDDDQLAARGYHPLVNAKQIAQLGVPGLDVIAVASSVVKSDPELVQRYVCAELQGSRDMTGPHAARYLAASAGVQGVPGDQIVAATRD